jgi:hypothetical protein
LAANASAAQGVFPAPTRFKNGLPLVSIVRPSSTQVAGAVATLNNLIAMNLFQGQPAGFTSMLMMLAQQADQANRTCS